MLSGSSARACTRALKTCTKGSLEPWLSFEARFLHFTTLTMSCASPSGSAAAPSRSVSSRSTLPLTKLSSEAVTGRIGCHSSCASPWRAGACSDEVREGKTAVVPAYYLWQGVERHLDLARGAKGLVGCAVAVDRDLERRGCFRRLEAKARIKGGLRPLNLGKHRCEATTCSAGDRKGARTASVRICSPDCRPASIT